MVVAADAFSEDCDALLAHRERRGHTVALVRAGDLWRAFGEGGKAGPAALAAFVKHAAARWRTRFVLLVGDADAIPSHALRSAYQTTKFANDPDLGTDHLSAEGGVALGRFPADTREELEAMIAKTIAYESRAPPGPWQRRIAFITGEGGFGAFIDTFIEGRFTLMVSEAIPPEYAIELAYAKPHSPYCPGPPAFNETALRLLNEGPLFYVYVGHGRRTGCDTIEFRGGSYRILDESDVGLVRAAVAPVMVVIACNTGEFDAKTGDCLGEALIKSRTGPVAFIGGSRVTQPYGNALLGAHLIDAFLRDSLTAGEALFAAKRRVLAKDEGNLRRDADRLAGLIQGSDALEPMRQDVVMHYNLLGDPALVLQRAPATLELDAQRTGRRLRVRARSPLAEGRAIVSIECARDRFLKPPGRFRASDPDLAAKFAERYRAANDKSVGRAELAVREGAVEVEFELPAELPKGKYFVRGFAWNARASALGVRELEISD